MIILRDIESYEIELQDILTAATIDIQSRSVTETGLLKLSGSAFEKIVCDTLNMISVNSEFHNKFEQASKHSFPDIYAKIKDNNWFGVEVKTSQENWKCFGNSIFESIRVPNLDDRIYIFFGKFSPTLECRWSKYEDCIDNINITHSPRYQINMEIKDDPTLSVFSKMSTTYLDFFNYDVPKRMDYVRKLKRKGLGQNAALWWLPDHEDPNIEDEKKLVIKLYTNLPAEKKTEIRNAAIALFPEIFSRNNKKYSQILPWLASQHGVVMGNIRDIFSSGGKQEVLFENTIYRLPKVCFYILSGKKQIKDVIINSSTEDLIDRWNLPSQTKFNNSDEKVFHWIKKASLNLSDLLSNQDHFPVKSWLESLF